MLALFRGSKGNRVAGEKKVLDKNPKVSLEFLPDGKVLSSIYWEPHSNVDVKMMASVINILNEGKLYNSFREAAIVQGRVSGDIELAETLCKSIKDPKSIEDDTPLIPASMVTRFHLAQQERIGGEL